MPNPVTGERQTIIEVDFHTGSCELMAIGSGRSTPEFPPHPARLFTAIVAAYYNQQMNLDEGDDVKTSWEALQTMECASPPFIYYPQTLFTHTYTEYRIDDAVLNITPKGKPSKAFMDIVKTPEPKYRSEAWTSRGFFPGKTKVYYVYSGQDTEKAIRTIEPLLRRIFYIGRADSFAHVRVLSDAEEMDREGTSEPYRVLYPDERGRHSLRTPYRGMLDDLEISFNEGTSPRVVTNNYALKGDVLEPLSAGWDIVGMYGITPKIPPIMALHLGKKVSDILLRMACDLKIEKRVQTLIHGHSETGEPLRSRHLAVFPLVEVGHPNSSGNIAGFGIAVPTGCQDAQVIRELMFHMNPEILLDKHPLRVIKNPSQLAKVYQASHWGGVHKQWVSVLPIAIPFTKVPSTVEKRHQLAYSATVMLRKHGLDVKSVRVQGHPFLSGPLPIEREWLKNWPLKNQPQKLWYVHITLHEKVRGPVLDGVNMHKGLSPFLPYSLESYECP